MPVWGEAASKIKNYVMYCHWFFSSEIPGHQRMNLNDAPNFLSSPTTCQSWFISHLTSAWKKKKKKSILPILVLLHLCMCTKTTSKTTFILQGLTRSTWNMCVCPWRRGMDMQECLFVYTRPVHVESQVLGFCLRKWGFGVVVLVFGHFHQNSGPCVGSIKAQPWLQEPACLFWLKCPNQMLFVDQLGATVVNYFFFPFTGWLTSSLETCSDVLKSLCQFIQIEG